MPGKDEIALEELLKEPIIRLIMASDGVHADEIRRLFREVHTRRFHCVQSVDHAREAA